MCAGLALAILVGTTSTAFAGGGFDIVIPGRPDVPIIINGIDASYAVIEGEWGLGRGEQVQPTIYGGRYVDLPSKVGHYYPSAGRVPGYGRLEIEPPANRKRRPAPRASINHGLRNRSAGPDRPTHIRRQIYAPQERFGQASGFYPPHDPLTEDPEATTPNSANRTH